MQTTGVQLLSDLYEVFDGAEKLWTETILSQLHKLPESAWGDVRGKPLNDRSLAAGLRKYSVKSRDVRIGDEVRKGYLAADFHDVWKRYVLPIRKEALQALQALQLGRTTKDTEWGAAERAETISRVADVADVALVRDSEGDAYDFEERAAIAEYDGGLTRAEAEARAAEEMLDIPAFLDRRTSHIQ
jgi:hypothetical protein